MPPFNQPNIERKNCVDNKVRDTIGDMFCPTCRNGKCVYISTNKMTSFYDCKKCKACCHVLNIPFKGQKPTKAVTVHIVLQERRVVTTKKENYLQFWRKSSGSYNQAHPILNQKGGSYSTDGIIVSTLHWLIQWTETSLILSVFTLSVYIEAASFSQSPTTVLNGLSTLDQIRWLWL